MNNKRLPEEIIKKDKDAINSKPILIQKDTREGTLFFLHFLI